VFQIVKYIGCSSGEGSRGRASRDARRARAAAPPSTYDVLKNTGRPHLYRGRPRPMERPAEGQSRPRFGQLAGRSVFNTRTDYAPKFDINSISLVLSSNRASPLLPPVRILAPPGFWPRTGDVGRTHAFWQSCARGRLGVCSPRMQTSSPTTKLLAGMPACASEAAAERVFSALAVTVTGGSFIQ
jgi:hypothetical protein